MDLKFLSWNVEHFSGKGTGSRHDRVARVAALIENENPDIFAIMEVEGSDVFTAFTDRFPSFVFSITEGQQSQEIMIGVRGGISAFMTQRTEFKRSNPYLRPGALLTVKNPASDLPLSILFSHFKSLPSPEGYGLRDAMFEKARSLKKAIDKQVRSTTGALNNAQFMLVGDLNTMGMNLTYSPKDLSGSEEIARVDRILRSRKMRRLGTTNPFTFNDGSHSTLEKSLLDHVYATENLAFTDVGGGAHVRVAGWAEEPTVADQDDWIAAYSDHAPLLFEVQGI